MGNQKEIRQTKPGCVWGAQNLSRKREFTVLQIEIEILNYLYGSTMGITYKTHENIINYIYNMHDVLSAIVVSYCMAKLLNEKQIVHVQNTRVYRLHETVLKCIDRVHHY